MCEILQLMPRKTRACGNLAPHPADVIMFPGVRVERKGMALGERILAGAATAHPEAAGLAWQEE